MFETMASFMLVEHANGAMFDPPLGPARLSAHGRAQPPAVPDQGRPHRGADLQRQALERVHRRRAAAVGDANCTPPSNSARNQIDAVYGLVAETIKERTTDEWLALFRELEIPAAPLRTPDALFDDPHLNAVGLFETVETPHGPVRFPGVPTWFSRTPGRVAGPHPELGADTAEVLEELGLASADIEPAVGSG